MKKKICFILVMVLIMAAMSGCGSDSKTDTESKDTKETVTIGYSNLDMKITYQAQLTEYMESYAKELGVKLISNDAQSDVVTQQNQVMTMIDQGVDALVVVPVDYTAVGPITEAAQAADIPLVYVNVNPYPDKNYPEGVYYVGSDETSAGVMQGEFMAKALGGKGGICILMGTLTHEAAQKRTAGAEEVIQKNSDMHVIAKETANWMDDQALSLAENWISTYGDEISGIISNNDDMAIAAASAFKAAGKKVPIIGIDGMEPGLTAVKSGVLAATVLQDCSGQAHNALKLAVDLVNGVEMDSQEILVEFKLITPENVGEYLK